MADEGSERAWEERVAGLFEQWRPRILARIDVLQEVADASDPDPESIEAARSEAHKLHGLLGTIGLPEGSELAAEIEAQLDAGDTTIGAGVDRLRAMVAGHA